ALVLDAVPLPGQSSWIAVVQVAYADGEPQTYALPLAFATGEDAYRLRTASPHAALAEVEAEEGRGLLHGAESEPSFARALLDVIGGGSRLRGAAGEVAGQATRAFAARAAQLPPDVQPRLLGAAPGHRPIRFGD